MGAYAFVMFWLLGLGWRSHYSDNHDAGVGQQLAKQQAEEAEYMHKPFEPELSSASLAAANVALADPLAAKGKTIFEGQACDACHGDGGVGTAAAPALTGISAKLSARPDGRTLQAPHRENDRRRHAACGYSFRRFKGFNRLYGEFEVRARKSLHSILSRFARLCFRQRI